MDTSHKVSGADGGVWSYHCPNLNVELCGIPILTIKRADEQNTVQELFVTALPILIPGNPWTLDTPDSATALS